MKTIILILALISTHGFGQNTLTVMNNPLPGDINKYMTCDTTNISEGGPGSGQTWNFTNLTRLDSIVFRFVSAGSTPYSIEFPGSNIASTIDDTSFNYFSASENSLLVNGNAAPGLIIYYSDPQLLMQYPFTFNSSFSDNFYSEYSGFGISTIRTGTTTVSGDAWGTISLPNGSFANALRVKYQTSTKDSSNPGIPVITNTDLTSYVWFLPGKKFPVFEIIYTRITFNGTPFGDFKVVNYCPINTTIGITNISTDAPSNYTLSQNYPNPFNPVTNIKFEILKPGFASLKIYNELGKEVATLVNESLSPGTYKYDFDATGLTSGMYFYTLKVNEFIESKKMTILK